MFTSFRYFHATAFTSTNIKKTKELEIKQPTPVHQCKQLLHLQGEDGFRTLERSFLKRSGCCCFAIAATFKSGTVYRGF